MPKDDRTILTKSGEASGLAIALLGLALIGVSLALMTMLPGLLPVWLREPVLLGFAGLAGLFVFACGYLTEFLALSTSIKSIGQRHDARIGSVACSAFALIIASVVILALPTFIVIVVLTARL